MMLTFQTVAPTLQETLMDGHSGDVYQIATHPAKPNICATVTDSGHVHIWDLAIRQCTLCAAVGFVPRSVAFSVGPIEGSHHLAVGGQKGNLKVSECGGWERMGGWVEVIN